MTGKVFISCGQRPPREKVVTDAVKRLLKEEFELEPYVALDVQGLDDITAVTDELRSSDYYLFIDFKRRTKAVQDLSCSLFTHQELVLAHHLGFRRQVIALQERGARNAGFLKYLQLNPCSFRDSDELIRKVRQLAREKQWHKEFSRNLVVTELERSDLVHYADHTGGFDQLIWKAKIENRRPDLAAVGAVCILDWIEDSSHRRVPAHDRAHLKWAFQSTYTPTLLPQDFGWVDLFAVRTDRPGLFLHSQRDIHPREPILEKNGAYKLGFKVYSREFPLLEFTITLDLQWAAPVHLAPWADRFEVLLQT